MLNQVQGDNKKCHSEFTTLLVTDYKEAYKGGCSKNISGAYQLEIKISNWSDAETSSARQVRFLMSS